MPLTLEQYATNYLDGRGLPWPAAPAIDPPKAKPHLRHLPVRAVVWNVYGTLLAIPGGELQFEHPMEFVTSAAFDKLIQEFKFWPAMHRQPGAPSAQLKAVYDRALTMLRMAGSGGEKFPELQCERVWEEVVKKLRDYKIDAIYGGLPEFAQKLAYFYHASIQGCGPYPGAADAIRIVSERGKLQGLLADGQCFTPAQLVRGLRQQDPGFDLAAHLPPDLRILSAAYRARKPSPTLFEAAVDALAARGLSPGEVLHVGSSLKRDIVPAKKAGMRTALFAGDKNSLDAPRDEIKAPDTRPDVLMTELTQIADVIG